MFFFFLSQTSKQVSGKTNLRIVHHALRDHRVHQQLVFFVHGWLLFSFSFSFSFPFTAFFSPLSSPATCFIDLGRYLGIYIPDIRYPPLPARKLPKRIYLLLFFCPSVRPSVRLGCVCIPDSLDRKSVV